MIVSDKNQFVHVILFRENNIYAKRTRESHDTMFSRRIDRLKRQYIESEGRGHIDNNSTATTVFHVHQFDSCLCAVNDANLEGYLQCWGVQKKNSKEEYKPN